MFVLWLVQSLFTAVAKATNTQLQDSISSCLNNMFNVSSEVFISKLDCIFDVEWFDPSLLYKLSICACSHQLWRIGCT